MKTLLQFYEGSQPPHRGNRPLFFAQECTQSLTLENGHQMAEDIFGRQFDLSLYAKKPIYTSTITGGGGLEALFHHVNQTVFWVACLVYLETNVFHDQSEICCARPPVPGSLEYRDLQGEKTPLEQEVIKDGKRLVFSKPISGWVRYRPLLKMRLKEYSVQRKEWEDLSQWKLVLEEVPDDKA